jgi:hypothetical protein
MSSQKHFTLLFFFLGFFSCFSKVNAQQVYPPFVFSQIPQDYQLYARNDNNLAIIPIQGTIQDKGWIAVSISVYRENKLFGYQKVNVQVKNPEDSFSANPTIKAEKAEYSIFIYAFKNDQDSVLITKRTNIVAGDFYAIYGDSNGNTQNVVNYYSTNKYIRTFGRYNHEAQRDYLPKDTTWSQNENYFLPRVGAWGTMLQELIASKYEIPVAIITGGGPGMNIDLLLDREGTGVNPGGVYNTFGYRIKKSGLINHIKGFFIWHGVYELFSKPNPIEYDAKVKKLMGYFKQDFPNIQQYVDFQSAMVRFNLNGDAGASIRESQRILASLFPKVIPYSVEGLAGYEGVHYTLDGYNNCANEMLSIIEPLFYNKPQEANILSPNILKAFYVDQTHQKIKMVFQENQQVVAGKDTTVKINGQNTDLSLKKWFYQDGNFTKNIDIHEISTNGNTMVLFNQNGYNAKKLSYLPPFHSAYADDFPVFVGPYIKNILGKRALSFNVVKIQEPLAKPNNLSATSTVSQIKLTWNNVQFPVNAQLIIERKSENEDIYKVVTVFKSNISEFTDIRLISATTYNYQIKVVSDSSESVYAQIAAKTLEGLGKPKLSATTLYNNKVQILCSTVFGAETYILYRRLKNSSSSAILLNFNSNTKTLIDSNLVPNQTYVYKVITTRSPNEMTSDSIEVTTPALLAKPELSSIILYYNSLKISWKPILGAISYQLDRKIANEDYKKMATFDGKVIEFLETDLKENTLYTYRLKAFGDKTESIESEISSQTPAILQTPEISSDIITHESIKLQWKAISGANKYVLERQAVGETTYQKIFETANLLEFTDAKLKDNLLYNYRLKALSSNSESNFAKIDLKTLVILSTLSEENNLFKLFPNPSHEKLTISFVELTSGNISFIDLSGKSIFELNLLKQKSVEINVSSFKKGIYLVLVKTNQELYVQKVIIE